MHIQCVKFLQGTLFGYTHLDHVHNGQQFSQVPIWAPGLVQGWVIMMHGETVVLIIIEVIGGFILELALSQCQLNPYSNIKYYDSVL